MLKYDEIIPGLSDNESFQYSVQLPQELGKKLQLGQSNWVCRYGTLSDGHEKITPAQRYFQAIKEMYYLGQNIERQRAAAMRAQAKLLMAEKALIHAKSDIEKLECEADVIDAKTSLTSALMTIEDQKRMLNEYNRIRQELQAEVEAKYPEGIEQAEPDNWKATYLYRMQKEKVPGLGRERTDNIPLDPISKATLGLEFGRLDSVAPLQLTDKLAMRELNQLFNESKKSIEHITEKK